MPGQGLFHFLPGSLHHGLGRQVFRIPLQSQFHPAGLVRTAAQVGPEARQVKDRQLSHATVDQGLQGAPGMGSHVAQLDLLGEQELIA